MDRMKKHLKLFNRMSHVILNRIKVTFRKQRRRVVQVSRALCRDGQHGSQHRRICLKNIKGIYIVAGLVISTVIVVVLFATFNDGKQQTIEAAGNDLVAMGGDFVPIPTQTQSTAPSMTITMPVYTSLSISEGMDAAIVTELQSRLMELDYMDVDEPGSVYEETTHTSCLCQKTLKFTPLPSVLKTQMLASFSSVSTSLAIYLNPPDISERIPKRQ